MTYNKITTLIEGTGTIVPCGYPAANTVSIDNLSASWIYIREAGAGGYIRPYVLGAVVPLLAPSPDVTVAWAAPAIVGNNPTPTGGRASFVFTDDKLAASPGLSIFTPGSGPGSVGIATYPTAPPGPPPPAHVFSVKGGAVVNTAIANGSDSPLPIGLVPLSWSVLFKCSLALASPAYIYTPVGYGMVDNHGPGSTARAFYLYTVAGDGVTTPDLAGINFSNNEGSAGCVALGVGALYDGNKHLLNVTWDGGTLITVYLDGVLIGTVNSAHSIGVGDADGFIVAGRIEGGVGSTTGYPGLIDETALFNYALTSAQITALQASRSSWANFRNTLLALAPVVLLGYDVSGPVDPGITPCADAMGTLTLVYQAGATLGQPSLVP